MPARREGFGDQIRERQNGISFRVSVERFPCGLTGNVWEWVIERPSSAIAANGVSYDSKHEQTQWERSLRLLVERVQPACALAEAKPMSAAEALR